MWQDEILLPTVFHLEPKIQWYIAYTNRYSSAAHLRRSLTTLIQICIIKNAMPKALPAETATITCPADIGLPEKAT
jgi:hypothetical protein